MMKNNKFKPTVRIKTHFPLAPMIIVVVTAQYSLMVRAELTLLLAIDD
jgi:hypothetical protein